MFHPLQNMGRRDNTAMNIRTQLYQAGCLLERDLINLKNQFDEGNGVRDEVLIAVGAAKGYCRLRRSLTPSIASDRFTDELFGRATKIERELRAG